MIVIICEKKKDQAEPIAEYLGFTYRSGSYFGSFNGMNAVIVAAAGHLLELEEPIDVKKDLSWSDPYSLLPIPTSPKFRIKKSSDKFSPRKILKNIETYVKKASRIILALDPDREGEAIGWNILNHIGFNGPISRLWLTDGMHKKGIEKAFKNIKNADETKYLLYSQRARSYSDWSWQFLTTAYTYYSRNGSFGDNLTRGKPIETVAPMGRLQIPILRFLVERREQIDQFIPLIYYPIKLDVSIESGEIEGIELAPEIDMKDLPKHSILHNKRPVIVDPSVASEYTENLNQASIYSVVAVENNAFSESPTPPHSLTSLQRIINKKHKVRIKKISEICKSGENIFKMYCHERGAVQ